MAAVVVMVFMCRGKGLSFKCRQTPKGRLNRNGINEPVSDCSSVGGLATGPNWLTTTTATNVLQFLVAIHSWRQSMFVSLHHSGYWHAVGPQSVCFSKWVRTRVYTHSAKNKEKVSFVCQMR